MNPQTGDIYEGIEQMKAAVARGEKLVEVSPEVAQLVRDGRKHQEQKARRREREKRARWSRRRNRG